MKLNIIALLCIHSRDNSVHVDDERNGVTVPGPEMTPARWGFASRSFCIGGQSHLVQIKPWAGKRVTAETHRLGGSTRNTFDCIIVNSFWYPTPELSSNTRARPRSR
jgi:hypothetical protein